MNRLLSAGLRDLIKSVPLLNAEAVIHSDFYAMRIGAPEAYVAERVKHDLARSMTAEIEKQAPVLHDFDVTRRRHYYRMSAVVMTQAELDVLVSRAYELGKAGK